MTDENEIYLTATVERLHKFPRLFEPSEAAPLLGRYFIAPEQ
ncbi:MAG: hypothetical protein WBL50_19815 [Candidatus Acidiferrum sp.]